jgi:hypothetical protein
MTDTGAGRLAHALGNMLTQNWKLLTLTLTGNRLGDNGAKAFAKVPIELIFVCYELIKLF